MRPVPIEDGDVWPGARRLVIGPPVGHELTGDIRPVEALVESSPQYGTVFRCKIQLEPGDLERLQANGGVFWVSQMSPRMVPWDVAIAEEVEP